MTVEGNILRKCTSMEMYIVKRNSHGATNGTNSDLLPTVNNKFLYIIGIWFLRGRGCPKFVGIINSFFYRGWPVRGQWKTYDTVFCILYLLSLKWE